MKVRLYGRGRWVEMEELELERCCGWLYRGPWARMAVRLVER